MDDNNLLLAKLDTITKRLTDIDEAQTLMFAQLIKTEEKLQKAIDKCASTDDFHKVMTSLDGIAKQYVDHEQDHALIDQRIDRLDPQAGWHVT